MYTYRLKFNIFIIVKKFCFQNSSAPEEYRNLPLVGKCCPLGQILRKNENTKAFCVASNFTDFKPTTSFKVFSPLFSNFNNTGFVAPGDERKQFVAVIGDPCQYQR